MSNQIICQCGKAFNTQNGFNAHKTYCSAYVSTLTLEEQERICKIQQERLRRKEQRMSNAKQKHELEEQKFISEQHRCLFCGKIMTKLCGSGQFCSKSCSSGYNFRRHEKEIEDKRRRNREETRKKDRERKAEERRQLEEQWLSENHTCIVCGKIITKVIGSGRFCSYECKQKFCGDHSEEMKQHIGQKVREAYQNPEVRQKHKEGIRRSINNGTFPFRNSQKMSYPETVWEKILQQNKIIYEYNYLVKHSDLGMSSNKKLTWYKFDFFLLDYNVDLEIDGGQHSTEWHSNYDRVRDQNIRNGGYNVYRIKWHGYSTIEEEVEKLLSFLKEIKL